MARAPVLPVALAGLVIGCNAPGYKNFPWHEGTTTTTTTTTTGESGPDDGSSGTSSTGTSGGSDSDGTSTSTSSPPDTTTTTTTLGPSTTTDLPPSCGDGLLDPGEECDDGDRDDSDGCNNLCARDRLVFVTSKVFQPWQIGGAMAADGICRQLAGNADLPNWQSYIAWISDSTASVVERLHPGQGRYVRVDGVVIADDLAALLTGPLQAPIRVDENGVATLDGGATWTGTNADGTAAPGLMCEDWTMNANFMIFGQTGKIQATDSRWTEHPNANPCIGSQPFYCFEGK